MGRVNSNNKIYTGVGKIILDFTYREFIYFIYNLGMDYYDGLNIISRDDWQDIFNCLKASYIEYEVLKNIKYKEFKERMSVLIDKKFYKHKFAYEVMMDAFSSFGKGDKNAKLKKIIKCFEEHEVLDNEFRIIDNKD